MDYPELAAEFFDKMRALRNAGSFKNISEAMHGEAFVLKFVSERGEEAIPGEIGHEMDLSSARIAQTLNNIEKKGWITREIDKTDRRKIIVRMTPEGRAEAECRRRHITGLVVRMLEFLGEKDAREYVRIMGRLAEMDPPPGCGENHDP